MSYSTHLITERFKCATPEEILRGSLWYRQAHSMARLLSAVSGLDVVGASALLAVLSPMNRWEDNVNDAFTIARDRHATVRTSGVNRYKAIRILEGEDPALVVGGRKVTAFWRSVADPLNSQEIPIDRHLYRVVLGVDVHFRIAAPSRGKEYEHCLDAYRAAAASIGIPITELASTVWLVSRRRREKGQLMLEW